MAALPAHLLPSEHLNSRLRGWWASENGTELESITEDAYKDARLSLEELPCPENRSWLDYRYSLEDVLHELRKAKDAYDSKPHSGARKWLVALSARIIHFNTILDVFVQQHPEYVTLVWGTFKFLFMAILNSEQLVKELAKSICRIAEILPRTEVAVLLYPTARIKIGVAQIYKHILRFTQKAIAWYKKGRLAHAMHAIVNPWNLQFEDDVTAIQEQSLIIEADASAASRAELRDAHLQIYKLQSQVNEMTLVLAQTNLSLQTRLLPLQETQTEILHAVLLNQIFSSGPLRGIPLSGKCLEFCLSFGSRRQNKAKLDQSQIARLTQRADEESTKVFVTKGWDKMRSRDFLIDLTALLRSSKKPIIFALRFPDFRDQPFTFVNLIQMLVAQALQINDSNYSNNRHTLSVIHLQDAVGEKEWLNILNTALRGLSYVFVVLDADLLNFAVANDRYKATKCVAALREVVTSTRLKLFVSGFSVDTFSFDVTLDPKDWETLQLNVPRSKSWKRSKTQMRRSHQGVQKRWR